MTVEPEVLLNRGGEDNLISRKENRENVTGIDKSRHLHICEAGEGVLSGLDSHGPEEGASSNAHYCPVSTNQTKEKVTQTTKNGEDGRSVQMKEAISNRERAVKQRRNLGKLETISEEDDPIVGKSMDDPETKLEPKLQVQNTRPLIDALPEVRNDRDVLIWSSLGICGWLLVTAGWRMATGGWQALRGGKVGLANGMAIWPWALPCYPSGTARRVRSPT